MKGVNSLQQNSDFLIPISLTPNVVNLCYFKLLIVLDQLIIVLNIKGLHNWIEKIGYRSFELVT